MKCGLRPVLQKPNAPCMKQQIGDSEKPKPKEEETEADSSLLSHDIRRALVRTLPLKLKHAVIAQSQPSCIFLSGRMSEWNSSQQSRVKQKGDEIRKTSGSFSCWIREKTLVAISSQSQQLSSLVWRSKRDGGVPAWSSFCP